MTCCTRVAREGRNVVAPPEKKAWDIPIQLARPEPLWVRDGVTLAGERHRRRASAEDSERAERESPTEQL